MKISDDVIEAGAEALERDTGYNLPLCRMLSRACITAALRQWEKEGVWCGKVPQPRGNGRYLPPYQSGFNVAIAEFNANRIGGTDEG